MSPLSDQSVAEFRELYRKETGKEITDAEAREYAERLLRLVAAIMRVEPDPPP